jgi:hypothetical protein
MGRLGWLGSPWAAAERAPHCGLRRAGSPLASACTLPFPRRRRRQAGRHEGRARVRAAQPVLVSHAAGCLRGAGRPSAARTQRPPSPLSACACIPITLPLPHHPPPPSTDYDKGMLHVAAIYATPIKPGVTRVMA